MTYTISKLGTLALKTQSAWGTAESSFASTDLLECAAPFIPPLAREPLRTDTFRAGFTEPTTVPGSKAPTEITLPAFPLHGWSAATPSGSPTSFPDLVLLGRALGSVVSGSAYTTALTSGAGVGVFNYTNGSGVAGWEGYAQLVPISGGRAIGWIADIDVSGDPDTGTLIESIAAAHSSTGTAYGSIGAYLSSVYDLSALTLQWLGSTSTDQIRYFDCGVSRVRIVAERKRQPMMEATLRALDWTAVGSGGAPTPAAYGYPQMPAFIGTNGVRAYLDGTALTTVHSVVIEITQDLVEVPGGSSSQGVSQWVASNRRVTVELKIAPTSTAATTGAPGDAVGGALQVDFNTTPGRSASMLLARPVLLEQPTLEDVGGVMVERRLYGALDYTGDDGSTAPADTPFRFFFL